MIQPITAISFNGTLRKQPSFKGIYNPNQPNLTAEMKEATARAWERYEMSLPEKIAEKAKPVLVGIKERFAGIFDFNISEGNSFMDPKTGDIIHFLPDDSVVRIPASISLEEIADKFDNFILNKEDINIDNFVKLKENTEAFKGALIDSADGFDSVAEAGGDSIADFIEKASDIVSDSGLL